MVAVCEPLCSCVSAERTAEYVARGRAETPSLLNAGRLAFRSQVVLRFGLRARLQAELPQLHCAAAAWALLRQLDIDDDGTAHRVLHTHDAFCAAFGLDFRR